LPDVNTPDRAVNEPPDRPLLISIHPLLAESILDGTTTVAVRRTRIPAPNGSLLILYASAPTKAVVGLATLQELHTDLPDVIWRRYGHRISLQRDEFDAHLAGARQVTALTLATPRRLSHPYPLAALRDEATFSPPPSYRYLLPTDPHSLRLLVSHR
jgi:predicted transcriptional regulator